MSGGIVLDLETKVIGLSPIIFLRDSVTYLYPMRLA